MGHLEVEKLAELGLPSNYIEVLRARGIRVLNPLQRAALEAGLLRGGNFVVVAPTASGKTLLGELLLVSEWAKGNMGVYLVPLRALANEKYREFSSLKQIGVSVGITTGDYDSPAEHLGQHDVVVATYERFDSLLRLRPSWLRRIGAVVIDELHMVGEPERGPIVEVIASRLLRDGRARILGLSATVGNPHTLASWLGAKLVETPWRPVKLVEGFYDKRRSRVEFVDGRTEEVEEGFGDRFLDLAWSSLSKGHQTLAFVHNRRKVEELAEASVELARRLWRTRAEEVGPLIEELRESPSSVERERLSRLISHGVAYHHAGLSWIARRVVEEAFRSRAVKLLFATPTLAAGVNLPARRVLVSIKRYEPGHGMSKVNVFEYKQMAGRAGRPQFDDVGESIIVDATNKSEAQKYMLGQPEPVHSKLANERSLRIHTLALVASGSGARELAEVFEATLWRMESLDSSYIGSLVASTLEVLERMRMVERRGNDYVATALGKLTAYTYLDPLTVDRYLASRPSTANEISLLFAITSTPDYARSRPRIPEDALDEVEQVALGYSKEGLVPEPPDDEVDYYEWLVSVAHAEALARWINEDEEDDIIEDFGIGPGDLYNMRETASWIAHALSRIEGRLGNVPQWRALSILSERLEHGVKEDALELVRLEGIGRVRARTLIRNGIRTLRDLASTPPSEVARLPGFGPKVVEKLWEQLKAMGLVRG
ncbi:MAG: DEAD/DEAH box helicase [Desulfurococcaceae archaeon]